MKVAHYTSDFSLHQTNLSDELYDILGEDFKYFEMCEEVNEEKRSYKNIQDRPYLIRVWRDDPDLNIAKEWALTADVAMFATNEIMTPLIDARLKKGLLTFEGGERWLKKGLKNIFSPLLLRNQWRYHTWYFNKPIYKLCASAFGANDQYLLRSYVDKCYKWGYFTKVENELPSERFYNSREKKISIMWCARFLDWKHPELVIGLAKLLKTQDYSFKIEMYGIGEELEATKSLCKEYDVQDVVTFKGKVSNDEILASMCCSDIFLLTSDRREGWGAVLNEAMSCGCPVVASNEIGSVPYLIKNNENGMVFVSKNLDSLCEKVTYLIDHPSIREKLGMNAFRTMKEVWSPKQAARNFIQLSDDLLHGRDSSIVEGPCSKALPIKQ